MRLKSLKIFRLGSGIIQQYRNQPHFFSSAHAQHKACIFCSSSGTLSSTNQKLSSCTLLIFTSDHGAYFQTVISNGKKIEPSIYKSTKKKEFEKINLQGKYFELVNNALYKVVNEQRGTAYSSRSDLYNFSGKTGTSQVKKITIETNKYQKAF